MRIKGHFFLIFKCSLVFTIILFFISSKKNNYTSKALENFEIKSYRLSNKNNFSIEFLNLGGIITSIKTPDKNNQYSDIVLGFEDFKISPIQYILVQSLVDMQIELKVGNLKLMVMNTI